MQALSGACTRDVIPLSLLAMTRFYLIELVYKRRER
jgi:hypothetical protein